MHLQYLKNCMVSKILYTSFLYFKGSKSSNIRIIELLKLPLPSPQQVLLCIQSSYGQHSLHCHGTLLRQQTRSCAALLGLLGVLSEGIPCTAPRPASEYQTALDGRSSHPCGAIIKAWYKYYKWIIYRRSICSRDWETPEESFSIDGAASMLFLSLSNRNKLGCFKINCHRKQTMATTGLRKSRRDVTA